MDAGSAPVYYPGYVLAYTRQNVLHKAPSIWVGVNDTSTGVEYTVDEAEALARALLDRVSAARAASRA